MRRALRSAVVVVVLVGAVGLPLRSALGLILGGTGNQPVNDPGWAAGAAEVFNQPTRLANWEGPPFGGGQWHGEYRGDADDLNAALERFAKIQADVKRVIVREGIGHSFWLNPNRDAAKDDASEIDWTFMVWQQSAWERQKQLPANWRPGDVAGDRDKPPVEMAVYTGGKIKWADVVVPAGVTVVDDRLDAHGFKSEDGAVLEGEITDLANKPLAARIELQRIEPLPKGGYRYTAVSHTSAITDGHWVLTKVPAGWFRVVASAEGVVPRVIANVRLDGQPGWQSYDAELSPVTAVKGHVVDGAGKALSGVDVRLDDVACKDKTYRTPEDCKMVTDVEGRFHFDLVAAGKTRVWVHKAGHTLRGLGPTVDTPTDDIELKMSSAGKVHAVVDFGSAARPQEYIVELTPIGGNVVGSWGGSSQISDRNDVSFNDVPPGRYELVGHPNPSSESENTKAIAVDVKGDETEEVKITAK